MADRNQAKWIWKPEFQDYDEELPGKFVLFRKVIELSWKPTQPCTIHVSADTRYRLFINGKSVAFGPCKSYLSRWFYETVDIARYLTEGTNVIAAKVLRFFPSQIGSSSMMKANAPGLIIWGNIDTEPFITDESWLCKEDPTVRLRSRSQWNYILGPPFLSLDEDVDFSMAISDWQEIETRNSDWHQAIPSVPYVKMMPAMEPWKLQPRPIPLLPENPTKFDNAIRNDGEVSLRQWSDMLAGNGEVTIKPGTTAWVEFETLKLATGFLEFDFVGGKSAEVQVLYAEGYERDLNVANSPFPKPRSKSNRRNFQSGRLYGNTDRIVLAAKEGYSTGYEPFWFRTFRFIRLSVTTQDAPLVVKRIAFRETSYPLKMTTKVDLPFELRQVWDLCLHTLRNCMHETYEDCPFYEQNQFAMDSRLQMLFTYQLSRDDRLARKTIHEFYASRRDDGLLETNYPISFRAINIPQFSLFWILMLHDHMMYFADQRMIQTYIGTADGILDHFDRLLNEDGLVGAFDAECWAFIDWVKEWHGTKGIRDMAVPPVYKKTGVAAYNSLLYAWVLQHAADMCDFVRRADTAAEYRARAAVLNDAVTKHCFNGELYTDGPSVPEVCQHTQIFAILSGAITGEAAVTLMHRTLSEPMPQCSYALKHYVFRALEKTGLYEQYFSQMMQTWTQMVEDNLTTCAEDDVSFRSDCHGWSASPVYEVMAVLYGIRPVTPGFKHVEVLPKRSLLKEGSAEYQLPRGTLSLHLVDGEELVVNFSKDATLMQGNAPGRHRIEPGTP